MVLASTGILYPPVSTSPPHKTGRGRGSHKEWLWGGRAQWSPLVEDVTVYMTRLWGIVKQLSEPASALSAFIGWIVNRENWTASLGHQGMTGK